MKYDRLPAIESAEHFILQTADSEFSAQKIDSLTRNYNLMIGGEPKVLAFGEEALTAVRDLKWMVEISEGSAPTPGSSQQSSKSEL